MLKFIVKYGGKNKCFYIFIVKIGRQVKSKVWYKLGIILILLYDIDVISDINWCSIFPINRGALLICKTHHKERERALVS